MNERLRIVTLCTGNAARSVMLGYMLAEISEVSGVDWRLRTAGTHVVEGQAMSSRTRDALRSVDQLGPHHYEQHRSHQLTSDDVAWADIVLGVEANHVNYVRAQFPDDAGKAVQLTQFVRDAPRGKAIVEQLLAVSRLELDGALDIPDPAGKAQAAYDVCATTLWRLTKLFFDVVTLTN
jgi:protein-tyrosine-phosphatase